MLAIGLATGGVLMMGFTVYLIWQSRFDTSAFNKTVLNEKKNLFLLRRMTGCLLRAR